MTTQSERRLRCRIGLHKKRLRSGYWADKTFMAVGVNLYECALCPWRMQGVGEPNEETR